MRGTWAGFDSASFYRGVVLSQRAIRTGSADRVGHVRLRSLRSSGPASFMRRVYALLIAVAVSIVLYRALDPRFSATGEHAVDAMWMAPALAGGAAVGLCLIVASGSRAGLAGLAHLGLPALRAEPRAIANGLTWAAVALLGVHFTAAAFDGLPGGHRLVGVLLGGAFGVGTYHLHRHAIEHEVYRTFNLVAMLLATGSIASMSITPTGAWWTRNFSTLGTSNDLAAACFNGAIIVSGLGIASLSASLTRALADGRFGLRPGARAVMQTLIALVGVCLMGVGVVPIDGATDLHNAFAVGAAAAFATLCLGVQLFASRMPRIFVCLSYGSLTVEVVAMVAYDGLGLFNLTVFEIVAFALVFVWLIALVVATAQGHSQHDRETDVAEHVGGIRRRSCSERRVSASIRVVWSAARRHHVPPDRTVHLRRLPPPVGPVRRRRSARRSQRSGRSGRVESRHGHRHRRNRPQRRPEPLRARVRR